MKSHTEQVLSALKDIGGIDLTGYCPHILEERIAVRMARSHMSDPDAYLNKLRTDRAECTRLIDAVMINVSSFFRNPVVFELIAQDILPGIIESKRRASSREIRVWSAGCAAGEEAYSIAILVHQALEGAGSRWNPYIFATDIDAGALRQAASAFFPRESFENTKLGILDTHFTPLEKGYRLRPPVRERVQFSHDDLTSPRTTAPPESIYGSFDLVLCRNVLIYLSGELQDRVLDKLYRSLSRKGYLVLGEAECLTAELGRKMDTLDGRNRIFQKRF